MYYADKIVKKNKYEIGDIVKVKSVKSYAGRITHMDYRFEGHVGWHYKIRVYGLTNTLTFAEKSLRKIPMR